jgi:hypothetical protein
MHMPMPSAVQILMHMIMSHVAQAPCTHPARIPQQHLSATQQITALQWTIGVHACCATKKPVASQQYCCAALTMHSLKHVVAAALAFDAVVCVHITP